MNEEKNQNLIKLIIKDPDSLSIMELDGSEKLPYRYFLSLTMAEPQLMPVYRPVLDAMMYHLTGKDIDNILNFEKYVVVDAGNLNKTLVEGGWMTPNSVKRDKRYGFRFVASDGARGLCKYLKEKSFKEITDGIRREDSISEESREERLNVIGEFLDEYPAAAPGSIFRQQLITPCLAYDPADGVIYLEDNAEGRQFASLYRCNTILRNQISSDSPDELLTAARRKLRKEFDKLPTRIPKTDDIGDYILRKAAASINAEK